ncbi:LytTR family DNA-binding domain-containing protein [Cytophagaceae bacterium DM2B3-1]|uniref:LytTR family DNA-binding domain-containing protein n=1 Tax=Xanthocytophaga flava TaxID=3048013 RepID=A0ABT7CR66_9BACT|nr:LytTR family DNA-binding domain-containing protein [Xanthocytophaga flavus]MDJ1466881.1 LytTR family DNA-binding domain-containing protein [Xanthocytophaga flavus]MDJ1496223.1 LytTR family DNA-binding domain-containing protein [Xanthocytophaga flavus]
MQLTGIVIDDEPMALQIMGSLAKQVPFLTISATFVSATEGLTYLQQHAVDILFLDIQMPDITGIELAKMVPDRTRIIFTTAYADFALLSYELAVTDYLLKPIALPRFLKACHKVQESIKASVLSQPQSPKLSLFVKSGYDLVSIDLEQLLYVEAEDNYLMFYIGTKRVLTRMTLSELLHRLPEHNYMRVHRSYIISLNKIEKIERHQLTIAGKQIPLSGTYRTELLLRLGQ